MFLFSTPTTPLSKLFSKAEDERMFRQTQLSSRYQFPKADLSNHPSYKEIADGDKNREASTFARSLLTRPVLSESDAFQVSPLLPIQSMEVPRDIPI